MATVASASASESQEEYSPPEPSSAGYSNPRLQPAAIKTIGKSVVVMVSLSVAKILSAMPAESTVA